MEKRFVTQADVAKQAGVSRPLVSLVMRGSPKVSDEKRERVLQAAQELGYIGSSIATSMAGNRDRPVIGFLSQSLSNGFFTDIYRGIQKVAEPSGCIVVVMEGSLDPKKEDSSLRNLVSLRPHGIILAGYAGSTYALKAASSTIPFVSVTRDISDHNVSSIVCNDFDGGVMATNHLVEQGHERILHLALPKEIPYRQRAKGYLQAMEAANLQPNIRHVQQTEEAGRAAALQVFTDSPGEYPTAIFCASDAIALGVLDAFRGLGVKASDCAVVGFDNITEAERLGLSSVDQKSQLQGSLAAKRLLRLLNQECDEPPSMVQVIDPQLIVRETSLTT